MYFLGQGAPIPGLMKIFRPTFEKSNCPWVHYNRYNYCMMEMPDWPSGLHTYTPILISKCDGQYPGPTLNYTLYACTFKESRIKFPMPLCYVFCSFLYRGRSENIIIPYNINTLTSPYLPYFSSSTHTETTILKVAISVFQCVCLFVCLPPPPSLPPWQEQTNMSITEL